MAALWTGLIWVWSILGTVPVWGALLWSLWDGVIRPRRIAPSEIGRLADELAARYGTRAEEAACLEEDQAWRSSDGFRQGLWRRVRRELHRRPAAAIRQGVPGHPLPKG